MSNRQGPRARPKIKCKKRSSRPVDSSEPAPSQVDMAPGQVARVTRTELYTFPPVDWSFVQTNQDNLVGAGLWLYVHRNFPEMDADLVEQFVKASSYGAQAEVQIQGRIVFFNTAAVSAKLGLPSEGVTLSGVEPLNTSLVSTTF